MFSILIPTWNNLAYLKLAVASIRRHSVPSAQPHQIILHINDGSDGTLAWAREQGLAYSHTAHNAGICLAVNQAAMQADRPYIVYLNDDMVVCPGWDTRLLARIQALPSNLFMVSGTMVEPRASGNACVVVRDFGDDFSMKLWHAGCRHFIGVGDALVYHFQCKTTGKIVKNDGRAQFLAKWGMTQGSFDRYFLRRGQLLQRVGTAGSGAVSEPEDSARFRWAQRKDRWKRRLAG